MSDVLRFDETTPDDRDKVGGKALGLGQLARAGLPVPAGFCVTTAAFRRIHEAGASGPSPLDSGERGWCEGTEAADCGDKFFNLSNQQVENLLPQPAVIPSPHPLSPEYRREGKEPEQAIGQQITQAYEVLGGGPVAVRSSATLEDSTTTSFAGLQVTTLGVVGPEAVLAAVKRCWDSLHSEGAQAYRQRHGIDEAQTGMAVIVQRLIHAEVAGVLFTHDPLDPEDRRMVVEAAWGLGETVVSGRVTPDRYHLDRESGAVAEQRIASKAVRRTAAGMEEVPPELRNQPCLDPGRLAELAALARRVEMVCGWPCDIEWAWEHGRFWLLQARPITTVSVAERERVRREEIAALRARALSGGTVWSRYNLAEVLPQPTPMSWAVARRLLSGRGGLGLMYRDFGIEPDARLNDDCTYDLVCGRPYSNLSREPLMIANGLPLEHPFRILKDAPEKALYPRPVPNPANAGWQFWLFLPLHFVRALRAQIRLRRLCRDTADALRALFPVWNAALDVEAAKDLNALTPAELVDRLNSLLEYTLCDMARESLKPTALAAFLMGNLEHALRSRLGPGRMQSALGQVIMGVSPDPEANLPQALRDWSEGRLTREDFLQRFGHRGEQEMELAQPRWSEASSALASASRLQPAPPGTGALDKAWSAWKTIAEEAKLPPARRVALERQLERLHTYLGLRETAKHYFMKGYALIRRYLVALDRHYRLGGGIFYLTPDQLPGLLAGEDLSPVIQARRRRRVVALSIETPAVLFSDDLEALDRAPENSGGERFQGVPLSAGLAEGPALVLSEPVSNELVSEPYILVCPSTDPAWVPLFLRGCGLVMETGGILSHGAIIARELGLPAIAGIPGIMNSLKSGQHVRVDGGSGRLTILRTD